VSAVHLSPAQFLHFDGDMIKNHMHASREKKKFKTLNSTKAENNPGYCNNNNKPYPTKWGRLHGSNYAIMFYHKPYVDPTH